jgi:hypothetical protein
LRWKNIPKFKVGVRTTKPQGRSEQAAWAAVKGGWFGPLP